MNNETNYKICDICGNLVDTNNIVNINENEFCKSCIERKLIKKNKFNPLTTFALSLIPGFAHIYLGKKKKGRFLLYSFIINLLFTFILIISIEFWDGFDLLFYLYLITLLASLISPCIIYLYSLFDANFSRKYIEDNTYKEDFVDKLINKKLKSKNKKYLEEKIIDKRLQ
mgnify:CR=1 FL=1